MDKSTANSLKWNLEEIVRKMAQAIMCELRAAQDEYIEELKGKVGDVLKSQLEVPRKRVKPPHHDEDCVPFDDDESPIMIDADDDEEEGEEEIPLFIHGNFVSNRGVRPGDYGGNGYMRTDVAMHVDGKYRVLYYNPMRGTVIYYKRCVQGYRVYLSDEQKREALGYIRSSKIFKYQMRRKA